MNKGIGKNYNLTYPRTAAPENIAEYYRTVDMEIMGTYDKARQDFSTEMRFDYKANTFKISTVEERLIWLKLSSAFIRNARGTVFIAAELCSGDTMLRFAEYQLLRENKEITHVAPLKIDLANTNLSKGLTPSEPQPIPKDLWARRQKEEWCKAIEDQVLSRFAGKYTVESVKQSYDVYISRGSEHISSIKADYIMEVWFTIREIDRLQQTDNHANDIELKEDLSRLKRLRKIADRYPDLLHFDEPPSHMEWKEAIVRPGSYGEYLFDLMNKFNQTVADIQNTLSGKGLSLEDALAHHSELITEPLKELLKEDPTRLSFNEKTMELIIKRTNFEGKLEDKTLATGLSWVKSNWNNTDRDVENAPEKSKQTRYKTMISRLGFPEIVLDQTLSLKEKEAMWGTGTEDYISRSKYQTAKEIEKEFLDSVKNNKTYGWPIKPAPDVESVQAPLDYTREKFMKLKERFLDMTQEHELISARGGNSANRR